MEKEIVYIADLDQDIDDIIAIHYLHKKGVLKCVVCDPYPKNKEGFERKENLEKIGINIQRKMPPVAKYVFVGGALTLVARHIQTHHIDWLVMNGGFVGSNIVKPGQELKKFKGKETVRTFNFNCDVMATDQVLKSYSKQIGHIVLVGKNVCHDARNTRIGIWKDSEYQEIFNLYPVKGSKLQHDMLACHEGLAFLSRSEKLCEYEIVRPYNTGLNGKFTEWGSTKNGNSPHREVLAAVGYAEEVKENENN